jgi:hypothetical protein
MHQLIFVAISAVFATGPPDVPDLILANGKIFSADAPRKWAEALAVRGERITAIGSSQEVLALAGPGTRKIDLNRYFTASGRVAGAERVFELAVVRGILGNYFHVCSSVAYLNFGV